MTEPVVTAPASTEPVATAAPAADANLVTGDAPVANAGEQAPRVVPEVYADFVAPEGIPLDPAAAKEFTSLAKELGMTQEEAQKTASIGFDVVQKVLQAKEQEAAEKKEAQSQAWRSQVLADKEFGGDKLQQTLTHANAFIQNYGGQELLAVLEEHGLSNNPAVIKALASAGKALLPDAILNGGASPVPVDPLAAMYPSMQPTVQ